jgi:hypothetical protein
VTVVAVPAAVFLLSGSNDTPDPPPTPSPADPLRGRYASAPQPCALITSPEAARLGVRTRARPRTQGCAWGDALGGGSIEVWLQHFAPTPGVSAPGLAEAYLADKERQFTVSAHAGDKINSTQSGVTRVPSITDGAFVYDATDGIDAGRSSTVWLRSSNVVIKVVYAEHAESADAVRVRQNAVEAARTVAGHL